MAWKVSYLYLSEPPDYDVQYGLRGETMQLLGNPNRLTQASKISMGGCW